MAKTYLSTVKYEILASYEITGVVEKPDIVGAIFGQSEGLLGEDMDLKELQQNGKIGRIEISVNKGKGTTKGEIIIPSSLDQVKTSILAATLETVEKVGPCEAKIKILKISDTRKEKREQITDRAKQLLEKMQKFEGVESSTLAETIKSGVRTGKIISLNGMDAGPEAMASEEIVIVEGRADVLKLLSYGIKNAVAMNGSNISKELVELCRKKTTTLLVDGDRGGELNAKKLASLTKIDFLAKAPDGKEVEELTQKEILQALKRKMPYSNNSYQNKAYGNGYTERNNFQRDGFPQRNNFQKSNYNNRFNPRPNFNYRTNDRIQGNFHARPMFNKPLFVPFNKPATGLPTIEAPTNVVSVEREIPKEAPKEVLSLKKDFDKIKGKLKARFLDSKNKKIKDVEVKEMLDALEKSKKKVSTILFDGIITKRLLDVAEKKDVKTIVGVRKGSASSDKIKTYTL